MVENTALASLVPGAERGPLRVLALSAKEPSMRPEKHDPATGIPPAEVFARVARELLALHETGQMSARVVDLAVETVAAARHAGLVCTDRRGPCAVAGSDGAGRTITELQVVLGEGPSVDAEDRGAAIEVLDLASETRWPTFTVHVLERTAVRSILVVPLRVDDRVIGTLHLDADQPGAFGARERRTATIFGIHVTGALHAALTHAQLRAGIASRDLIGQAKGILMAEQAIDAQTAFQQLATASQHTNRKLRDIAQRVVSTAERRPVVAAPRSDPTAWIITEAIRAIVTRTSNEDIVAVLLGTVDRLGGRVIPAEEADEHALPLNLSLGGGRPLLATPDPASPDAARTLRTQLPRLVEDAREAISRLELRMVPIDLPAAAARKGTS